MNEVNAISRAAMRPRSEPCRLAEGPAAVRNLLSVSLAALALVGCAKAGSQAASANVATPQAGDAASAAAANGPATNVAATNPAAMAANSLAQTGSGVASMPGLPQSNASATASAVTIQFQRGANCWKYAGEAATFNGRFAAGQQLVVSSTGESAEASGSGYVSMTQPRRVFVAGADGKLLTPYAPGYFTIPASGAYQITFDPMSMIGAPGEMIVCTQLGN